MKKSFKDVLTAIVPMTVFIILLTFIFAPLSFFEMTTFLIGAGIMIFGMTLFLFGADRSMMQVGDLVGKLLVKKKKLSFFIWLGFSIGFVITIAEPSLQILAQQVFDISKGAIPRLLLLMVVSIGTGIFLAGALLRIVFKWSYYHLMLVGYLLTFVVSFFTSKEFMPIAFDAGGVTTGPVTVPFILALAVGLTSMTKQRKNENDSFGLVGIASLGPILTVMILGVIFK